MTIHRPSAAPRSASPTAPRNLAFALRFAASLLVASSMAAEAATGRPVEPPAEALAPFDPDAPIHRFRSLLNEYDAWWRYEFPDDARSMLAETRADAITEFGIPIETRRNGVREVFLEELTSILQAAQPNELGPSGPDSVELLRWELTRGIARHTSGRSLLVVADGSGPHWSLDAIVDQLAALPARPQPSEPRNEGDAAPAPDAPSWRSELETRLNRVEWVAHQCHAAVEALRAAYERGHTPSRMEIELLREDVRRALARGERRFAEAVAAAKPFLMPEAFESLTTRLETRTLPAWRDGMNALEAFFASDAIAFARAETGLAATADGRARFSVLLAEAMTADGDAAPTATEVVASARSSISAWHAELVDALQHTPWARASGWTAGDRRTVAEADLRAYRLDLATRLGLAAGARSESERFERLHALASAFEAALPALVRRWPQTPITIRSTTDAPRGVPAAPNGADYLPGAIAFGKAAIIEIDGDATGSLLPHALLGAIFGRHLEQALAAEMAQARGGVHRSITSTVLSEGWRAYAATQLPALLPSLPSGVTSVLTPNDARALELIALIEQAALAEAEFVLHALEVPAGAERPNAAARLGEVTGWTAREVERALRRTALAPGEAMAGFFGMQAIRAVRLTRETQAPPLDAVRLAAFHTDALALGRRTINSFLKAMRPTL